MAIRFRHEKSKLWQFFFFMPPPTHFFWKFDLTLTANNSPLKTATLKITTFSETSGRQLSNGAPPGYGIVFENFE